MGRPVTSALMGDPPKGRTPWADPSGPTDGLSPTARILAPPDEQWQGRPEEKTKGNAMGVQDMPPHSGKHLDNLLTPLRTRADAERALSEAAAAPPVAALRPVGPVDLADLTSTEPATPPPLVEWMLPSDLLVDEQYQRGLSPKSLDLIRRIVHGWDWRRFKPPIVAWTEAGFEVIDGQHTAIAAATHPTIEKIPVLVVEAAQVTDRAHAFVGHNKDRLNVSAMQLHHAMVAAGDEEAATVEQVCSRAGVNLVRSAYGGYAWKAGDTVAVEAIRKLVQVRGALAARQVLEALVRAGCAPVTAAQIKAADFLLTTDQYADQLEPYPQNVADLAQAIRQWGDGADKEARLFAKANCVPQWKALAVTWFSKTKKRRKAA